MKSELRAATLLILMAAVCSTGCDTSADPVGAGPAGSGGHAAGAAGAGAAAGTGGGAGTSLAAAGTTGQAGHGGTEACPCPSDGPTHPVTARQPLGCLCDGTAPPASCGLTLAKFEVAPRCNTATATMMRWTGCGKIAYVTSYGLGGGETDTFDAASGALVGIEQFGDAGFGQCGQASYIFGDTFRSCADAQECLVCGDFNYDNAPKCK